MRALPVAAVLLALAGCLQPASTSLPPTGVEALGAVFEIVQAHDHADPSLHEGIAGFELLGWHNGYSDDGTWPDGGGVNEVAVRDGIVFLARSAPQGGFSVLDARDPRNVTLLGEFDAEGLADIDLSWDGKWVFASTQRTVPAPQAVAAAPTAHTPRGVYVVDVSDPAAPRLESFHPLPVNGPHTATYAEIDGAPYVFLQTYDLMDQPALNVFGAVTVTQRVWVTEFVVEGGRHVLRPVAQWSVTEVGLAGELFPHDSSFQVRPDGTPMLTVAYWDAGLRLVDVSDPRAPREVSGFTDFHPSVEVNLHDAKAFDVAIGGRHVTVTGPELPTSPEDGQLTFVDTTDPAAPAWLGAWSLPGDNVVDEPFIFSPHVFEATDDARVYVGHNHGGVWAIDAADPEDPKTAGWFMPTKAREGWTGRIPSTWGVRWPGDGLLYVSDGPTGLYVLRPTYVRG